MVEADFRRGDIRLDGMPRTSAPRLIHHDAGPSSNPSSGPWPTPPIRANGRHLSLMSRVIAQVIEHQRSLVAEQVFEGSRGCVA